MFYRDGAIHYQLSDSELAVAKLLATARNEMNRTIGTTNDRRAGSKSDYLVNYEGICAELAFCRLMNVYPDLVNGSYGAGDCKVKQYGVVDVKYSGLIRGDLLVPPKKQGRGIDTFALMVGEIPDMYFVGTADQADVFRPDNTKMFERGLNHVVPQHELTYPDGTRPPGSMTMEDALEEMRNGL